MSANVFDLQVHTSASDGGHSPREVLEMAKTAGLSVVAITDHDTVGAMEDSFWAGGEFGIRVIPGIEMSVEERGAHILGYGLDCKNPELLQELEKFRQGRIEGAKKMTENLKRAGFKIEWEEVLSEAKGVVARPHIARAILNRPENKEKLRGVSTIHEFIQNFLADDSPNYVKRSHIYAASAIDLIKKAGGLAVWSHPAIQFPGDYDGLENFLRKLMKEGLAGLEVFNPSHSEDDTEFLFDLAQKHKLLKTAGSDFHEKGSHPKDLLTGLHSAEAPGDYPTYGFSTENIIADLDAAVSKNKIPREGEKINF